ncbi:MAG: DPP IV N-terminal domain-containing protein [Verrucomicrobiales bacterium]
MRPILLAIIVFPWLTGPLVGQGTATDYERAARLPERTAGLVVRDRVPARWMDGGASFWYSMALPGGGEEFWSVDARTGVKTRLEAPPSAEAGKASPVAPRPSPLGGDETTLTIANRSAEPLQLYWIDPEGAWKSYGGVRPGEERAQHTYAGHVWLLVGPAGEKVACYQATSDPTRAVVDADVAPVEEAPPHRHSRRAESPGPFEAKIENNNVSLTSAGAEGSVILSTDGTAEDAYRGPFRWSPDSAFLACLRVRPATPRQIQLIESSPSDQLQPKVRTLDYPKPGDAIDHPRLALFHIAEKRAIPVDTSLFPAPWSLDDFQWSADGREFRFLYNQRGHQIVRLLAIDAATGSVRCVVEESSPTFIDYTNKVWYHWMDATGEVLWMSERDGWNHLWLYDTTNGQLKNQVTTGPWVVRRIERVDESARQVWFAAMGVRAEQSPYHVHLCRINFDGSGLTILTAGDGTQTWEFSPDRNTFLARWSRVDQPTVTELRRSSDGSLIAEVERGDASALLATGWRPAERFVAKGRDGTTDIHGIIVRPTHLEPGRRYPVIEKIYAGPHDHFVPQSFSLMSRDRQIAELGFILVQIDGMGTNWRHKGFHNVCWKNLHDAGLPDRIAWLKAAAAAHLEMDLTRVGIFGGSAGGQSAMRALIDHGDFYKVAVADCGCHDNRMDKIWWNEQWMGWPVDASYEAASNVVHAHRMQGRLLLTVGELDTNVDPASTYQVVNALIKAGKSFDFLPIPGAGHGVGEEPYPSRRRMDFFVRHLWGIEPPLPGAASDEAANSPEAPN